MARSSADERVGLKHVAEAAGVSVKTVSNVVNGYVHVTDATRTRVQQALDELNYRPNLAARNLRQGRSDVIALALPELDLPYFAELARSVIKSAEARGWTVLIDQTDGLVEREQLVIDGIRGRLIDGLIFSPIALGAEELERRRDTVPLVLLGERVYDGPADHVSIDSVAAGRVATGHLVGLGRRRIAAIGDQPRPQSQTAHLRRRGYEQALADAGLPVLPDLLVEVDAYHRADGAAAARQLMALPEPPDAVFCFNDLMALGALRALLELGVRVPQDVAVVGWDDIEDGRYSTPTLTTISPDKQQIASLAVEFLAARLGEGRVEPPREVTAGFELMVRESSVGRPGDRFDSSLCNVVNGGDARTKEFALTTTSPRTDYDTAAIEQALMTDGITALTGAFPPEWADRMREDIEAAFDEAINREGGAVGRGPNRYYVEIHPEQLRGFVDIVSHPWFRTVCETVLGPDYKVLELGFDIPFAGAQNQPWHRDFPSPRETHEGRRLTSLAFNLTAVDTAEDMGPFEIAPGTQWEPGLDWDHQMFPPRDEWPRFESIAQRKYPKRGDISVRSALTLHRGTANQSEKSRPVLVVGVDAPGAGHDEFHDMAMTREFHDSIPADVRAHLLGRVVDRLEPIVQQHTIEGLVMGEA